MVGQQCINFSICIIANHFGDVASKVCECLIRRGSLSFLEIVRFTELPQRQVKNCLLVLVQHNCIQAFSISQEVGPGVTKLSTLYMIILDNIFHQIRFSKFCLIVKEHLGNHCAEILEGLLQHGRLTFELLYNRASGLSGGRSRRDDVLANFNKLVHARYVERCPKGEPFIEPKSDEVSSIRKRIKPGEQIRTIEQEAISAAVPVDADRFSGIMDLTMNTEEDMKDANHDPSLEVSAGNKRKHELIETSEDIQDKISMNEVQWRINYEKFVQCLKKKACVSYAKSKFGPDAAIVLEAIIESSDHQNVSMNSATSSMNHIIESVRGKPGGTSFTLELVRPILEQLGCQLCKEVSGTLYTIDLKDIIETCQNDEVESFVLKKYGKEAYRIFRLLTKRGGLVPMDQISDSTFLEKKEAQKILCQLWKDGYLEMEKVNLNVGVRSDVFLWKANKKILWEHVLSDMFHAAFNVCQKIFHVVEECLVSHADSEKVQRLRRAHRILETSLLKMDDSLMLFHDF